MKKKKEKAGCRRVTQQCRIGDIHRRLRQFLSTGGCDSDTSFAGSRPSSIGVNSRSFAIPISDRSYQLSAMHITETLKFILCRFEFSSLESQKLEDKLQTLMKSLNCPVKLNKSALRAPGTPHYWPSLFVAIHWLVQLCKFDDHRLSSAQPPASENKELSYAIESYLHYLRGKDDQRLIENVNVMEGNEKTQEEKLEAMKKGPLKKNVLENEKSALEEDVKKFHAMIEQLEGHLMVMEKLLEEKEKGLETKVADKEMICAENEEDAKRMKREVQALEMDIKNQRNGWEEKAWDLDSAVLLPSLANFDFEVYQLDRSMSSVNSFGMYDSLEAQFDLVKNGRQDFTYICATEARKMVEEVETETGKLDQVEREAVDFSKASKAKLQETIVQTKEEVQICARELFPIVDRVSKYKEYISSKIAMMKNDLAETAGDIAGLPGSEQAVDTKSITIRVVIVILVVQQFFVHIAFSSNEGTYKYSLAAWCFLRSQ
ncbi:hypothetical protein R3W88_003382 [Solanum pinnatisectum]|uniref:Kinetochore protein NDC80 n=1 Tax=Solanum pinnatisectum TaxID=50273 RepID=A0AAV9MS25_9SOLN|nr:hypothetical protein R3W88_003382 [Solanum pinnatisectum]